MQKRLRIIHSVNVRWFNATAWYGLSLASLMRGAGHEVLVYGLENTESFARAAAMGLKPRPFSLNTLNPLRVPSLLRQLAGEVRSFRPHVVNCHRGEGMLFWGLLKNGRHPFALVRTRGDQRPPKGNVPNKILHARVADAVIATNSRTARQCRALFGLGDGRLFTIPGGVDTARFASFPEKRLAVRARLGFVEDDLVVGLLGRFDAVKGQKELIASLGRLVRCRGNGGFAGRVRLMLVGAAASFDSGSVERWLCEAGLSGRAVLTGRVDDVAAHINAMDLGVVASQGSEAIARAALEIMACGVPLVGTDVGVMPDLLTPHALAAPGDEGALDALLLRALSDGSFRRTLAAEQAATLPGFTQQAFLRDTLVVYEAAIARLGLCAS